MPDVKDKSDNVVVRATTLTPIALPESSTLIPEILKSMHHHPLAAHIGQKKMLAAMRPRFWWKGWSKQVAEYVRSCHHCQLYKALRRLQPSAILPFHAPHPFETLGIDLIGPFPRARGKCYVLTVLCHFGRWLWLLPLPSKSAKHVARALYEHVVLPMCIPKRILSDRGGEFVNEVMKHLCALLEIAHPLSAPWHPQTNGKNENSHKFIKKSLAILVAEHGRLWVDYLSALEFAWRHAKIAWADKTPFECTMGFAGPLPLDLLTAPAARIIADGKRFHAAHLARLASSWQQVTQLRDKFESSMVGGDVDAQAFPIYHEGSEVCAWLPSHEAGSQALMTQWRGPFLVIRRLGAKTYRLLDRRSDTGFNISVDNMHPYKRRSAKLAGSEVEPERHWAEEGSVVSRGRRGESVKAAVGAAPSPPDLGRTPARPELDETVDEAATSSPDLGRAPARPKPKKAVKRSDDAISTSVTDVLYASPDTGRWERAEVIGGELGDEKWVIRLIGKRTTIVADPLDELIEYDEAKAGEEWTDGDERTRPADEDGLTEYLPEAEEDPPFDSLSYADQQRVVKEAIAMINEVNQQLEVKRSSIPGIARQYPYGVFARRRLRKALVIGSYRGEVIGQAEFDRRYPTNQSRYVLELKRRVYIDATDPFKAGAGRFVNDCGPGRKPNVKYVRCKEKILLQTLRLILPGEELLSSYGSAYYWKEGEQKAAPTDAVGVENKEAGGARLPVSVHPDTDATPEEVLSERAEPGPPSIAQDHLDFESDSLVLYAGGEIGPWLIGSVLAVDAARPYVEVHRYGSLQLLRGKALRTCKFRPAFVDPRDGKQVFTSRPLVRYAPVLDIIEFADVMERDFYLTNSGLLPDAVIRTIAALSS